jgi:hypothetical protein
MSDNLTKPPNKSPEPTQVGRFSFTVDIVIPAWLSFGR